MSLNVLVVGGIYLPAFLVFVAAAAVIYFLLRFVLLRVHAYRLFWHPAAAGAALFIVILSGIILLFGP